MLSFSIKYLGDDIIAFSLLTVWFLGLLDINSRTFIGNSTSVPSPKLSKSLSQSIGREQLEKSCFSNSTFPKSWLFFPFPLKRYWKTSCLNGMIVGDKLFEARFSKIAACKASTLELINSWVGFGFKYALKREKINKDNLFLVR